MGVDWYPCCICDETFPDCGSYTHCINCEDMICGRCYEEQKEKYGIIGKDHEKIDYYGEDALNKCDSCVVDEEKENIKNETIEILTKVRKLYGKDKVDINIFFEYNSYKIEKLIKQLKGI